MRIMVLGLRGIPGVQGGVETHAEQLYPRLSRLGCEVEVLVRSRYVGKEIGDAWNGVGLRRLWGAPGGRVKGAESFIHSMLGVLYAAVRRPDLLHIHAVGPGLMVPMARALGLKVVFTHHGPDYDREKWSPLARLLLKAGEWAGVRCAHRTIVISNAIREVVRLKQGREASLIPNGVEVHDIPATSGSLTSFGLEPGRYVLQVSRLVPEKRHLDLVQAFLKAELKGWKLVLVGGLDVKDEYTRKVMNLAAENDDIVLTGFQTGSKLRELYAHAGFFVLPSSHEGLPIVLLEALSYGLPVLASDIEANIEVGLSSDHYFLLGNVESLAERLREYACKSCHDAERNSLRNWVRSKYDWNRVAARTMEVYREILRAPGLASSCEVDASS
jgi:glycosyltransferase involved in cell wall biosynthesis